MPRIFDNIDTDLLPALEQTLLVSERADFCVGYFNLRGWEQLDAYVDKWQGGAEHQCSLLVGMQWLPQEELRQCLSPVRKDEPIDNQTAVRLKRRLAEEFRDQLAFETPSGAVENGLRQLASQFKFDPTFNSNTINGSIWQFPPDEPHFIIVHDIKCRLGCDAEKEEG